MTVRMVNGGLTNVMGPIGADVQYLPYLTMILLYTPAISPVMVTVLSDATSSDNPGCDIPFLKNFMESKVPGVR